MRRSIYSLVFAVPVFVSALYDEYILAPTSRTLYPSSVYHINGTVENSDSLLGGSAGESAKFVDNSAVTYDFSKNIGGVVTLTVSAISDDKQFIGVTFTESSLWISGQWSDATADAGNDEPLWFQPSGPGEYTVDLKNQRGGFRYMSLVHNTTGSVEVSKVSIHFTAVPHLSEDQIHNYTGYFHSNGKRRGTSPETK